MRVVRLTSFVHGVVMVAVLGATEPETPPDRLSPGRVTRAVDNPRLEQLLERNRDPAVSLPETLLAKHLAAWRSLPIGERIARWAELFQRRGDATYSFGIRPGGYVAEGLLVQDFKQDCVLNVYRCTELARARSSEEAIVLALTTRFAGGEPARVVGTTGAVDYDDPSHLDYSEDILRSGLWGRDVTVEVGVAIRDSVGSSRYPPDSFSYIPTKQLRLERLQDGDLLYFVVDETHERGLRLRQKVGTLIGHQGIVRREKDKVYVIHAALSDLPGSYKGNRVVRVPLVEYLRRVELFKGIMVSRIEDDDEG